MSAQTFLIIVCIIPSILVGIAMAIAQMNFLKSYRKIINPNKRITLEEMGKDVFKSPANYLGFFKDVFTGYPFRVLDAYYKHYDNPVLERQASLVRKLFILLCVVPFVGFILTFILYH